VDELSPQQIKKQKSALLALKKELSASLASAQDSARPVDLDEPIGRLSRMDAIQRQQIAKATLRNQERTLNLVEAALSAMENGGYGVCRRCDMPIDVGRLKARPETSLCIECAEELEQRR
jgi:DnaK suppressor protein